MVTLMSFQLCGNILGIESLFSCIINTQKQETEKNSNIFSLVIDKRISSYPFNIEENESRISIVDKNLKYLNTPKMLSSLPAIFLSKNIKGKQLMDVLHPEVAPFYRNLLLSSFQEKSIIKLHIILNSKHILLTTYPLIDNRNKIIAYTLVELPFTDVASDNEVKNSSEIIPP
jgi:hypothetical protein